MKALIVPRERERKGTVKFPTDYTQHIPDFAWGWLNQYGLDRTDTQKFRFGYSEARESLVLPVFIAGELAMYQTRYFGSDPKQPKYRTFGFNNDVIFFPQEHPEHDVVVLVEDYISAIKVSRVTNCMPLWGSAVSQEVIYRLTKMFKRAKIWLDPDMKEKSIKTALIMSGMGIPTTTVFSDRDPKMYMTADIRRMLGPTEKDQ